MQRLEWHCHTKSVSGALYKAILYHVSLPEKRWQTVLSSISGGTQAVTGFPSPKMEENSRHATQQPETHDHQWWLDVSVVRRVSTSKQTGDDNVLVHQLSTEVSQQGTVAQYHGGNNASEHTNETVLSPGLSTTVVHGEVAWCHWCVLTFLQRTLVEQRHSTQTAGAATVHSIHQPVLKNSSQPWWPRGRSEASWKLAAQLRWGLTADDA